MCGGILARTAVLTLVFFAFVQISRAQGSVGVGVNPINEFSIDVPASGQLVISSATAGAQPDDVEATTPWAFTTNGNTARTLTASLNAAPPTGLTLSLNLGSPTNAYAAPSGGSVGTASGGNFTSTSYTGIVLWSGAIKAVADGTATWTATATVDVDDTQDYSGTITLTFE